jgi:hypothetical protein
MPTANIALGDLLALILTELDDAIVQTVKPADLFRRERAPGAPAGRASGRGAAAMPVLPEVLNLHVSELDLDLPAHLQVHTDRCAPDGARLVVTLPSTLEHPPAGRMGRIRLTIAPDQPSPM